MSLIYNISGVSGSSGIDIKDLDFSNETVNDTQKKIVAVATNSAKYGISARSGYCQAWVADVYQAVTGSRGSAHCALCAAEMWAVSSDFSQIPVGATVYGYSSSKYGHVGIYIGNGMVAHNIGEIKIQSLEVGLKLTKALLGEIMKYMAKNKADNCYDVCFESIRKNYFLVFFILLNRSCFHSKF